VVAMGDALYNSVVGGRGVAVWCGATWWGLGRGPA
jgi:hypothetical protein